MDTLEIGCCGAFCKTCREYGKTCKGCKVGYADFLEQAAAWTGAYGKL